MAGRNWVSRGLPFHWTFEKPVHNAVTHFSCLKIWTNPFSCRLTCLNICCYTRVVCLNIQSKGRNMIQPLTKTNKMACAPSKDSDQPGHPLCAQWAAKNRSFLHADSAGSDQIDLKKPTDLDLHCLPLHMWIYSNSPDQVIWLAEN